jgi:hypothetical protein
MYAWMYVSLLTLPLWHHFALYYNVKISIRKTNSPTTHLWRRRGRGYSSYSFPSRHYTGVSGYRHALDSPPGKEPTVPIVQEAGWAPEPVWIQRLEEKSSCLWRGSNLDRAVAQSVVRHYTAWATPASVKISSRLLVIYCFVETVGWDRTVFIYGKLCTCTSVQSIKTCSVH